MKHKITVFLLLCFCISLAAVLPHNVSAQEKTDYKAIIGTWNMTVLIEGVEEYSTFVFSVKNDTLRGVWSSMDGDIPLTNLTLKDNEFSGELLVPSDYDYMTVYVTGKIDGEKMKGKGEGGGMEYPFTAIRKKEKKK